MLIRCRSDDDYGVLFTRDSDVRRVDFDGQGSDLAGRYEVPKELPIHGEILKARPDVGCVIHAHPQPPSCAASRSWSYDRSLEPSTYRL
jgi:3,4-dihydroxyphthalate decarboxylase